MRSKVNLKGHPVHPILVSFPIAFFLGTFLLDILSLLVHRNLFGIMAFYLNGAAIIFALIAAIPGFIDFLFTVPPESSARKRAARHGILNVTVVLIFSVVLFLRQRQDLSPGIIGLETAGVILLSVAGWMGGTLVFRNQIGIDHRYAQAGKWKEEYLEYGSGKIEVAKRGELKVDQMKLVHIRNHRIVICHTEKGYAAFDDRCPHRGASLAGGSMICGTVQCPWHGSQFDVITGKAKAGPAAENIKTFQIAESDAGIFLMLDEYPGRPLP